MQRSIKNLKVRRNSPKQQQVRRRKLGRKNKAAKKKNNFSEIIKQDHKLM
jgi:hypothetical protein